MKDINATVIINLALSEEEILEKLHKDARWGIKRAEREKLTVELAKSDQDWQEFYELYKKTIVEGGANVETLEHLKENDKVLFLCKKDNRIIAGAGISIKNDIPKLARNASLKEFLNLQPNNLLYWNCILWCKNNGYEKFDLGGWQINARRHLKGINKFKEKWGEVVYSHKDYPWHIAIGRKLIRKFDFLWWLNNKLRGRK